MPLHEDYELPKWDSEFLGRPTRPRLTSFRYQCRLRRHNLYRNVRENASFWLPQPCFLLLGSM